MKGRALTYLHQAVGHTDVEFREGQWECIDAIMRRQRLLVVERTGWGKSMVYFVATKLLREQGMGPTLLISPLLALMRNQIAAAKGLSIRAKTINSSNRDEWKQIEAELRQDEIDLLLISPERLANEDFHVNVLQHIAHRVGFFVVDQRRIDRVTAMRRAEQQDMLAYAQTRDCLMQYLARKLDDSYARPCGECANCAGRPLLPAKAGSALTNKAAIFLRRSYQVIQPRRQWPAGNAFPIYGFHGRIDTDLQAAEGRALSIWGDAGWGELVENGKYKMGRFSDELVEACEEMLNRWAPDPAPGWITCVPSLRHPNLMPDFAQRLATRLRLPFSPGVGKVREGNPQKEMENSFRQAHNLDGMFEVDRSQVQNEPVLLLDDMIDSGWTLTVVAALLRRLGCPCVYPSALALVSVRIK